MTTNTTGPAELRAWIVRPDIRTFLFPDDVAELDVFAAAWEADIARAERLTAAASGCGMVSEMDGLPEVAVLVVGLHERAEKAEAELAASRENHIDANKRNIAANERAERVEAALERARALLKRLEWEGGFDNCPICVNFRVYGHEPGCELAAALSPAPDGAR